MAPVSHGTSACAISAFAPPTTNKISAMVPAYFSMTVLSRYPAAEQPLRKNWWAEYVNSLHVPLWSYRLMGR